MFNTIFITGIGTDVGKTITAAILTEALQADYWKPVQAGYAEGTDSEFIRSVITNKKTTVHPETYKLKLAASPHIAAREEGIEIELNKIYYDYFKIINNQQSIINGEWSIVNKTPLNIQSLQTQDSSLITHHSSLITHSSPLTTHHLIIEGAGGLMVPLSENEFVIDLVKKINAKVILVSRNYLGSINHSLLTATACKQNNIDVLGWIFNDHYMDYEDEIVQWSGYPKIASLPFVKAVTTEWIYKQANIIRSNIKLIT
ncbi:MAG TPA: ATP-dependent dethiobiotin synthetase BioD [Parafilimonas sp.]|nr:ATP-dependent dethiobiotin synthetase BioD [Parafilimonas sp.]